MRKVSPFLCAALLALAAGCASSSNASTPATPPAAASSGGDTATAPSATMETAPTTAPSPLSATAEPTANTATSANTANSEPAATTASTTSNAANTATTANTPPAANTAGPAPTPPAAGGAQLVARGRAVHNRVCATCHEPGEHEGPNPGLNWAEDRMRRQIRQGGGRMRAIAATRLNDADLDALIAFYRSNRTVRGS